MRVKVGESGVTVVLPETGEQLVETVEGAMLIRPAVKDLTRLGSSVWRAKSSIGSEVRHSTWPSQSRWLSGVLEVSVEVIGKEH